MSFLFSLKEAQASDEKKCSLTKTPQVSLNSSISACALAGSLSTAVAGFQTLRFREVWFDGVNLVLLVQCFLDG